MRTRFLGSLLRASSQGKFAALTGAPLPSHLALLKPESTWRGLEMPWKQSCTGLARQTGLGKVPPEQPPRPASIWVGPTQVCITLIPKCFHLITAVA